MPDSNSPSEIDPTSPVPLYHQIAEAIRGRIERGELRSGDALEPLREAAENWGVNLHTVRHAYTALSREGVLETRGTRGTRVAAGGSGLPREDREAFLDRMVQEAEATFGLDVSDLVSALQARMGGRPVVFVVECSSWQCESHCDELQQAFDIDARPWSLAEPSEPPDGTILATYFHYNDIRRRWAHRLHEVQFVTIRPTMALRDQAGVGVTRVLVFERDEETAQNVAADVECVLQREVTPRFGKDIGPVIEKLKDSDVLFVAPRVWAKIDEASRSHPRVHEARYVFDRDELGNLADAQAWPRHLQGARV